MDEIGFNWPSLERLAEMQETVSRDVSKVMAVFPTNALYLLAISAANGELTEKARVECGEKGVEAVAMLANALTAAAMFGEYVKRREAEALC